MKQNSLEKLLQQDAPPPNPAARLAARRVALAEFERLKGGSIGDAAGARRGFFAKLAAAWRGTGDVTPFYQRRMLLGGAASVCVAVLGSTLVWNTYKRQPELTALSAPATTAAAVPAEAARPAVAQTSTVTGPLPAPAPETSEAVKAKAPPRASFAEVSKPASGAAPAAAAASPVVVAGKLPQPPAQNVAPEAVQAAPMDELAKVSGALKSEAPPAVPAAALASTSGPSAPAAQAKSALTHEFTTVPADAETDSGQVDMSGLQRKPALSTNASVATMERDDSVRREGSNTQRGTPRPVHAGAARSSSGTVRMVNEPAAADAEAKPATKQAEGQDRFEHFDSSPVRQVSEGAVSTFSADVDTSSYSFVRKQLEQGVLPQKDAVRVEEMVNYFDYAWPAAESRERPFKPTVMVTDSPWSKGRKLIHIGIKGFDLPADLRPNANLVMLLDVSGSMDAPDRLPLVKQSMKLLLGSLKPADSVGIVVYAGAAGMVLPPTPVSEKEKIVAALDGVTPSGPAAGAQGIELAYQLAEKSFLKDGVNRVLLCTGGDFNVGITGTNELRSFVERKRASGIYLSVLGFGQGSYRDELAQALAQNGNGVAAYIDTLNEAQKVLVQESGASLFPIAKDVKFQVEFNPATVAEYRLVGYETRALKREDFNNDKMDAGDVGSGHEVTVIYEITPLNGLRAIDASRYQRLAEARGSKNEYGYLRMRYKLPGSSSSQLVDQPILVNSGNVPEDVRRDVEFSTAVAGFAQLLRGGQYTGSLTYDDVIKSALASRGEDPYGYRSEFVQLVRKAQVAK